MTFTTKNCHSLLLHFNNSAIKHKDAFFRKKKTKMS